MREPGFVNCILMHKGNKIEPYWCSCGSLHIRVIGDAGYCEDCGRKHQYSIFGRRDGWKILEIMRRPIDPVSPKSLYDKNKRIKVLGDSKDV